MSVKTTDAAASRPSRATKQASREATVASIASGMELLGEIITWKCVDTHHKDAVVAALRDAGLDEKLVKGRHPRHAFSRACKQLEEERVIDEVRDDPDELVFQFTKRYLHDTTDADAGNKEMSYRKETVVRLNKTTGVVKCKVEEVRQLAQKELDRCLVERTAGDVTQIVQQLFSRHADLIPLRDQGAVYFVPKMYSSFTLQVDAFLRKLGGKINRFPVPAGVAYCDVSVQEAVADHLGKLLDEHNKAVDTFTENTRTSAIRRAAESINETRVKVEAYALYLADKKAELEAAVDAANARLAEAVDRVVAAREASDTDEVAEESNDEQSAETTGDADAA